MFGLGGWLRANSGAFRVSGFLIKGIAGGCRGSSACKNPFRTHGLKSLRGQKFRIEGSTIRHLDYGGTFLDSTGQRCSNPNPTEQLGLGFPNFGTSLLKVSGVGSRDEWCGSHGSSGFDSGLDTHKLFATGRHSGTQSKQSVTLNQPWQLLNPESLHPRPRIFNLKS